ncbi:hypothetical protein GCM10027059_34910 [Myceligenerans halotolerans]
MGGLNGDIEIPGQVWERAEVRQALRARRVGDVFRLVQQHTGASQATIAAAVGMTQARVNEVINGRREINKLDVFERIATGLRMPSDARHLLGLASSRDGSEGGPAFDLAAFPEIVRVYPDQRSAATEIRQIARESAEIDVLAVRGLGLLGLNDSLLRARIEAGGVRVRVLLLDPECAAVDQRAAEIGESSASFADGIRLAESRLRELADGVDIQVYRYSTLPTWRIIRCDAAMFIGTFDAGWEGHESAAYKVMATDVGPLHRGFRRMFDAMLTDAQRTV